MDRELVALVGAGLQVVAGGVGITVPRGSIVEGYRFVDYLLRFGDSGLQDLVIGTILETWTEWRRSPLPLVVAGEHIAALPELLERYRLDRSVLMGAVAQANAPATASEAQERAAATAAARRLASLIIEQAAKAGAFNGSGLSQQLSFFFVERLLAPIIVERQVLRCVHGGIVQYYTRFERELASAAPSPDLDWSSGPDVRPERTDLAGQRCA